MITTPSRTKTPWRDRLLAGWARRRWRGLLRLKSLLKPVGGGSAVLTSSSYETRFHLTLWDSVDTHVIREGFYESEVVEALKPGLTHHPDAVLWVVGANFGLHSITLKYLYPATRVVAFEPSPAMTARLLENAELNGVALELHTYALSDTSGIQTFHANNLGNPGMSTLHPCNSRDYQQQFHVAVYRPSEIIAAGIAPAPDMMVIDAEGSELAILRGLGDVLAGGRLKTVIFEAGKHLLDSPQDELHRLLTDAGFTLTMLQRREHTAHELENYLASKR